MRRRLRFVRVQNMVEILTSYLEGVALATNNSESGIESRKPIDILLIFATDFRFVFVFCGKHAHNDGCWFSFLPVPANNECGWRKYETMITSLLPDDWLHTPQHERGTHLGLNEWGRLLFTFNQPSERVFSLPCCHYCHNNNEICW